MINNSIMKQFLFSLSALLAIGMLSLTSCIKKDFDAPPDTTGYDPNLPVTHSIWQLKQLYTGAPTKIEDDMTIAGVVVADDRSGNFYKQIVVQDTSSGIVVLLGRSNLYNDFPIGRKVYIQCKGLYLGAYGSFIQLGSTPDITNALSEIPNAMISKYVVKANFDPTQVTARKVSILDLKNVTLNTKWLGTLIEVDSAEFILADAGQPYAQDPTISSGTDRTIEDCAGSKVVVRNSGYANFRTALTPTGKGPIKAIYSRYNNTPQIIIRDTNDVNFKAVRCGGVIITPAADITIDSLRKMYNGNMMLGNVRIHGVVTSSYKDSNISKGSLYLQDESGRGINIYYGGTVTYKMGDSLSIELVGDSLITYKGLLEIDKASAKTTVVGTNKTVTPVNVNIAALLADLNNAVVKNRIYESVVVRITGCTISGTGTTYSGSKTITDASGSMTLYSRNAPPYSTTNFPTSTVTITGLASIFNSPQVLLRSLADVQ